MEKSKMTTIEKVILGVIVLMVIALAVIIPSAVREVRSGVDEVKAIGLKGVVERVWEGTNAGK